MYWYDRWRQRPGRRVERARGGHDEAVASAAVGSTTRPVARDMEAAGHNSGSPEGTRPRDLAHDDAAFADHSADRSAHRMYAEVVWSTFDRLPLVAPEARASVETGLIALCRRLDVEPVAVKVSATRARLVLRFKPAHSIGAVVTALKLGSQDAAVVAGRPIRWAPGFACLSLSVTEVRRRALRLRARH